ncbi:hypothetical protein ACIGZI_31935 [Streptomyces griseus]|uniref:hypothetical protein n=1 Tax=Streptomyces griseus TaxID=1911 RepID=UPI0037D16EAF
MPIFLLGLLLGLPSGVGPSLSTGAPHLGGIIGVIAAVLTWLGIAILIICGD